MSFSIPIGQDADTAQIAALKQSIANMQAQIDGLTVTTAAVAKAVSGPIITNFAQDADINTSDLIRRTFGYANSDFRPAFWYARLNSLTTQFTDSTNATESPESIKLVQVTGGASISLGAPTTLITAAAFFTAGMVGENVFIQGAGAAGADLTTTITAFTDSTHVTINTAASTAIAGKTIAVYPTADTLWNKNTGELMWGGADCVVQPWNKNYARPGVGNRIFVLAKLKYNSDFHIAPIASDKKMRISVWDNTTGIQKIIQGADFSAVATLVSGPGAVTRNYIVKVNTPAPAPNNYFFSNVATPAQVTSTADPLAGSPGQISIVFPIFPPEIAQSYEVYRSDSIRGLANYYKIAEIDTGINNAQDLGGLGSSPPITIAATYMMAQAIILDIGDKITSDGWNELSAQILLPPTYNLAATAANSQWLRFDILNADGSLATIASKAILIDRISTAYTDGAWQLSPFDIAAAGDFQSAQPDPNNGNPGGGGSGGGGGGSIGREESLPF